MKKADKVNKIDVKCEVLKTTHNFLVKASNDFLIRYIHSLKITIKT